MRTLVLLFLYIAAVAAGPRNPQRIVGGSAATLGQYPSTAALLYSSTGTIPYHQACSGVILNYRSILTVAHCTSGDVANRWRFRVGSINPDSGGLLYTSNTIVNHPQFNKATYDNDLAIVRTASNITFSVNAHAAPIASSSYNLADDQVVWTAGWGSNWYNGPSTDQLRHVQVFTINQDVCKQRYASTGNTITENMLCSGVLDVGGRGQCQGDSGSPLYHHGVVVGVYSWSQGCGLPFYPGVNVRVSLYQTWIQANS